MPAEPKHRIISRELLAEIAAGRYGPSGRLPSETQLCKRFNVSRPTAARALRDLQEEGLIERRAGSGTYVRSGGASSGPAGGRQFGLLIPGLGTTEIFDVLCGELAALVRGQEYVLLWGSIARPPADRQSSAAEVQEWCEQFISRQVAGVFFAPFEHLPHEAEINRRLTERLRQAGIAVVLLDRDFAPSPARSEFDLVAIDNFAAGYLVAQHLLRLGSRRPIFVARPRSASSVALRIAAARTAIHDHGLIPPADFLRTGEPEDARFIQLLAEAGDFDAAICANDQTAAMLMRGLAHKGLRVPRDVRVVGFDDVRFATLVSPPLTTVHQPCRQIAQAAFEAMLQRISDPALPPRSILLAPRLVVRESCGAYLQGQSDKTT
jgi:DNA-binding LacI/PurR family transcriptional regulator